MRTRILLGTALMVLVAAALAADQLLETRSVVSALLLGAGLLSWSELAVFAGVASRARGGGALLYLVGLVGTGYFLVLAWCRPEPDSDSLALLSGGLFGTTVAAFGAVMFRRDYRRGFEPLVVTLLGVLLCGFLLSFLLRVYRQAGPEWLAPFVLVGLKGNDIVAFFVGSRFGRIRYLHVSPRKTLEGTIAAILFSAAWFGMGGALWPEILFPWPRGVALGIILSIAVQMGDLSESLLKRQYAVKDSGILLPEFGGVLDLIDSFLFAGFLLWLFLGA